MNSTEIPVLVGVTGHRDLLEPEKVGELLETFFSKLSSALPDTRFCLVSGMAAGADQIFVECGKRVLGDRAEVLAVLPFSRQEYQKDFSAEELPAYQRLLDSADHVEELPGSRDREAESYFAEGRYLIDHVNILVSVWDGCIACDRNGNPQKGGTWEVSDLWMNYEQDEPKDLFSTDRTSALIRIPAKRTASAKRIDKPYKIKDFGLGDTNELVVFDPTLSPDKFLSRSFSCRGFDRVLKQLDSYNALCKKDCPGRAVSKEFLGIQNTTGIEKEIERFAILDDTANTTQKRYGKQFLRIFMLSFLLGVCAQIYGGVNHDFLSFNFFSCHFRPVTWSLPVYFLLVVCVFFYAFVQRRMGTDNKYLDYRILAELLRIAIFWKIAGINENVKDSFLRKDPEHAEWTVIALKNWTFLDARAPDRKECINDTDVRKAWVEDQYKYYKKTAERLKKQAKKIHRRAVVVAGISMLFGVYFFVDTFLVRLTPQFLHGSLYAMNGILVGFGSFFMASLNFFLEKKGWDETAESYFSKEKLFELIFKRLEHMPPEKVPVYLSYLGHTAIREHTEWLDQQRKRRPDPSI